MILKRLVTYYLHSFAGLSKEVWLLSLICLVNRSGTMVIAFLSLYLTDELGLSVKRAGIIMGAYGAGSLVGNIVGGYLTDRVGYYKTQFWSMLISGFCFMMLYHIHSYYGLIAAIFLSNAIAESFRPANMASFTIYSKPENLSRSISLYRLAVNLGYAIGPAVGGFAIAYLNYQWVFYMDGLTYILAAILFINLLKEKKTNPAKAVVSKKRFGVLSDGYFLFFMLLTLVLAMSFMQLIYTLPLYFKDVLHLNAFEIGLLMTFNGLLIVFVEMPAIFEIERRKISGFQMMALGAVFISVGFWVYLSVAWWPIAVCSIFFLSIGEVLNFPLAGTFTLQRSEEHNRGAYSGAFGVAFSIGFMFAPIFGTQIIASYGFSMLFMTVGLLTLAVAVGNILLRQAIENEHKVDRAIPK